MAIYRSAVCSGSKELRWGVALNNALLSATPGSESRTIWCTPVTLTHTFFESWILRSTSNVANYRLRHSTLFARSLGDTACKNSQREFLASLTRGGAPSLEVNLTTPAESPCFTKTILFFRRKTRKIFCDNSL